MKISCLQENLSKGLSIVGRAVASRSSLPVLSNVLLATDEGRLRLAATNLEIGISCWIGAKVLEDGATTVPARLLTDFINQQPAGPIDLDLSVRTASLNVRCPRNEANIKVIDAQDFPPVPTAETSEGYIEVEAEVLRQMINRVVFSAATDESRPILTGVLATFEDGRLTMAAADGYRLSVQSIPLPKPVPNKVEVIIPGRALAELARISADQDTPVRVMVTPSHNQVLFHMRDVDLVTQLIEGRFPDYRQIIPAAHTNRTVVDIDAFLKATRVSHLFARDAANIVRLEMAAGDDLNPGRLTLTATSNELGDNVGQLDATVDGEPIEIAFNAKYLIDVLSVLGAAQVSLETSSASSPGVLRVVGEDDFVHVIMPMHLSH